MNCKQHIHIHTIYNINKSSSPVKMNSVLIRWIGYLLIWLILHVTAVSFYFSRYFEITKFQIVASQQKTNHLLKLINCLSLLKYMCVVYLGLLFLYQWLTSYNSIYILLLKLCLFCIQLYDNLKLSVRKNMHKPVTPRIYHTKAVCFFIHV